MTKARLFFGSFAITAIIICGMCGFLLVDLSTDKYMPGQFQSLYRINSITADGLNFTFMGNEYVLSGRPLEAYSEEIYRFRGLMPPSEFLIWQGVLYAKDGLDKLDLYGEGTTDFE